MPVVHLGSTYVGNSTSTAHQIWSGGKGGKFGFEYENIKYDSSAEYYNNPLWTWSGFELDGTPNSVKFTPDPVNGGLQGDFSYGIGSNTSKYPSAVSTYNLLKPKSLMEVDPAGGTLEFSMIARELSYWHKIGPVLRVSNTSQLGNDMTISEFRTYFFDNKSQYDIQKVPFNTKVDSLYYVKSTNTYSYEYMFDVWKSDTSTTYQPSKNNKTDLTFTCYVGPNNTPYSAYTYIDLTGFANEINNLEYNSINSRHPYLKGEVSGGSMTIDHPPLGRPVEVNDYSASGNKVDWRLGGQHDKWQVDGDGIECPRLIAFWQKPNVLYYVHMLWVNPLYTDYDNPPTNALMTTWTTSWNVEVQDMLLYVEFGISPDGGKNIFWNNAKGSGVIGTAIQKVYNRGITATVPTDIHKYIKPSIESSSVNRQSVTPYSLSSVSTCSCKSTTPFKFVKMRVKLSSKNDEHNNLSKNRYQKYAVLNYKQEREPYYHTDNGVIHTYTTASEDPNNNGIHYANYGKNGMNLTSFTCQVGRKYKTNNWDLQMSASLYYESGSMRYEGNTNIHTK